MSTPSLFDNLSLPDPPKAGHVPTTSVQTAKALGSYLDYRERVALELLSKWTITREYPPTSGELARAFDCDRPAQKDLTWWTLFVRRGLSGLKDKHAAEWVPNGIRRCVVSKRECVTWREVIR